MRSRVIALAWLGLAGCAGTPAIPADLARLLYEAPEGEPARLVLEGDRIVAATVPLGQAGVPPAVRTAIDAVAPDGEIVFRGREWGPRGAGFRIEKRYEDGGVEHFRSALIAPGGQVLERAHSVPLGEAPAAVLRAALAFGRDVSRVMIVSGPAHEEYWQCTVTDRIGRTYAVIVGLDARARAILRRVTTHVGA